ncbi:hypothetical protein GGX14DRAFT_676083 [Mycena pura]|uniref:Uncharacterized protein n=1 Tax=Mycena pura TaxID=153505 RepID=A0AAD6VSW8_9AGAR|nr:hypothetical protein GGX14DRAFT_676083 [Mycena pura]
MSATPNDLPAPPPLTTLQQTALDELLIHLGVKPTQLHAGPPPAKRRKTLLAPAPKRWRNAASFFMRGINLVVNISCVLDDGAAARWHPNAEDIESELPSEILEQRNAHKELFERLMLHVADLEPVLRYIYAYHNNAWSLLVSEFNHVARQTRQNDSNDFKFRFHYLVPNPSIDVLDPPLNTCESKEDRGFAHEWTRRLLLPFRDRFCLPPYVFKSAGLAPGVAPPDTRTARQKERGERILERIDRKTYKPSDKLFQLFLYDETLRDKTDPTRGLLRSYIIVRGLRHIWTSPQTAINGLPAKGIPRRCNATTHKAFRMTPEMVAYVVDHLYCMMSTYEWNKCPRNDELYEDILSLFNGENADDEWAGDTLIYLQSQVFGHYRGGQPADHQSDDSDSDDSDDCDSMDAIKLINDTRRVERAQAALRAAAAAHAAAPAAL